MAFPLSLFDSNLLKWSHGYWTRVWAISTTLWFQRPCFSLISCFSTSDKLQLSRPVILYFCRISSLISSIKPLIPMCWVVSIPWLDRPCFIFKSSQLFPNDYSEPKDPSLLYSLLSSSWRTCAKTIIAICSRSWENSLLPILLMIL